MKDVLIIGGGAAGVMAAIQLSRKKKKIELWDKNDKLLRKVLISGNGRCNITNTDVTPDHYYTTNKKSLYTIFNQFSNYDTIHFFKELGLELKEEKNGRLFPVTNQAISVYDVLLEELKFWNIPVLLKTSAKSIIYKPDRIEVFNNRNEKKHFKNVLIATGGKSYPFMGSSGDGYDFAKQLGHTITPIVPALAPLILSKKIFNSLQGVKVDVEISVQKSNFYGEMMFTHYGLSGPVILDLSLPFAEHIDKGNFAIFINFFPTKNQDTLKQYLKDRWSKMPNRNLANSFSGILPSKAIHSLLSLIEGIHPEKKISEISKKELNKLTEKLTHWEIMISGSRGFNEAQVTKGGVALNEIDLRTMESKIKNHIFFAGELLDVTGKSGGFNLQFAWSTGAIAGQNI